MFGESQKEKSKGQYISIMGLDCYTKFLSVSNNGGVVPSGESGEYPNCTLGFVHIDDVVAAHILAMEHPKASGRIICSSTVAHWSEIIAMLRIKYPSYPFESK